MLVDGNQDSHASHEVAEHINATGVDVVLLAELRINEILKPHRARRKRYRRGS